MKNLIHGNQKHLTQDDRIIIEKGLDDRLSFRAISISVEKDPSTIAKEIKQHRISKTHNTFNESRNKCSLKKSCKHTYLCGKGALCHGKMCKSCPSCNRVCNDFVPISWHCDLLDKPPYVCNGCEKKSVCRLDKLFYKATFAYREYRSVLKESRTGINMTEEDFLYLDDTVSPLIKQGHSPYMILHNHPDLCISEKTLYNYIDSGILTVKNIDLSKKVKYKLRKVHDSEIDDKGIFEGRTYNDYQRFIHSYPDVRIVEMDTVIGCEGSRKVLLTFHFGETNFMMAYLLASKESKYVEKVFDQIEKAIGTVIFCSVFPLILTDRGGEFKHPDALECGDLNIIRTSIYYCDPMASWQKPHCEKNHEYIRKVCPKGSSFDNLTQKDINLMMSHINSASRESLGGLTPFDMAKIMLPSELLDYFALTEIEPDKVILTPELLKERQTTKK